MSLLFKHFSRVCEQYCAQRSKHCIACIRHRHASSFKRKSSDISVTYHQLYEDWVNRFISADIPEPKESAGFIFAHLLNKKTFSLIPHSRMQNRITSKEIVIANELCQKRLKRMPIQYIIGEWDFYDINLKMKSPVFIPRPETEELVEHVLNDIRHRLHHDLNTKCNTTLKVLEIGCGTGAITLSLLNKLKDEAIEFVAIDAANHAVALSEENAERLQLNSLNKLHLLHLKLANKDSIGTLKKYGPFDVIVSNPPYIPTSDMNELAEEILLYEDDLALHGGRDGLDVINEIIACSKDLLNKNGSVWLEVDSSHPSILKTIYKDWIVEPYKDIFDNPRFCHLRKSMT